MSEINQNPETLRLQENENRERNWQRWGPYLSDRQWSTVREDYSHDGNCWSYFPHEDSRSRAYRWGEDGLLGLSDRQCRMCFGLALWNGEDEILKERLFGLTSHEGNHGEDVKEEYFHLESTPTHSYMKALYKYPHAAFPYKKLVDENASRGRSSREYELKDTGVFNEDRYFDVFIEYAKSKPNDILIRIKIFNRGPEKKSLSVLPSLWFRNNWSWGEKSLAREGKPLMMASGVNQVETRQSTLGRFYFSARPLDENKRIPLLFTENESIPAFQTKIDKQSENQFYKDAFHRYLIDKDYQAVNPARRGTKAAFYYELELEAGGSEEICLRLSSENDMPKHPFEEEFEETIHQRIREADVFYQQIIPEELSTREKELSRMAYAGLCWTKQFYYYDVRQWLKGSGVHHPVPHSRAMGRNAEWAHLSNKDIISMPDKWEYPWYASWDLAFHMIPMSQIDLPFAKQQLLLFTKEWYMHPNGQMPAYEFAFSDVNPPVHAWACWQVYKKSRDIGKPDIDFLARVFHKLLLNFTWWVNRKDKTGRNLFSGGFLGLDNIGVFDRGAPLPTGGVLQQADGTAWMAFYCGGMLKIALELCKDQDRYGDLAHKFFQHFIAIADAMNSFGGRGLWDEEDGFYYDQILINDEPIPLKVRSMVGVIPLFASVILDENVVLDIPGFSKRMYWLIQNRKDLAKNITYMEAFGEVEHQKFLLAIPGRKQLEAVLEKVFDEEEFLSPYGIRSLSKFHKDNPYIFRVGEQEYRVDYSPGESNTAMFGGNSNWRGPVWFPLNFLLIQSLKRYYHFYGDGLKIEVPKGSGKMMNLKECAEEISRRLVKLFMPDAKGKKPVFEGDERYAKSPHYKNLNLFYEFFHGDTGEGLGASHQTGWTALVASCLEEILKE